MSKRSSCNINGDANIRPRSARTSIESNSSDFFNSFESSLNFIHGDYGHNREILDNLEVESVLDDVDEDRLIYLATKKFAKDPQYRTRRQIVVSSRELNKDDDSSHQFEDSDIEAVGPSQNNCIMQKIFMIFKGDDSYMEVSREEIQRVRVMHKRFKEGAEFSFNYNVLLIIASVIAALGLGSNSTATIIASMLVSPLMGPVMGMAYGATILDLKLFCMSFRTEILSLLACIGVGAVVSACIIPFYNLPEGEWPTEEMISRAIMSNFYVGIPIAFASGLGVAVSVLDDQTASLVGVAISASLLPPAINAGMLWTTYFFVHDEAKQSAHYGIKGLISLGLTLVNILMIILSSMLMFRLKEVLPIKKKKIFWTDLGLARKIYQNLALYDSNEDSPMRRAGRRISTMFGSSNDSSVRSVSNRSSSDRMSSPNDRRWGRKVVSNNGGLPRTTLDVPDGTAVTESTRSRALSTVVEEERLSGYSSA